MATQLEKRPDETITSFTFRRIRAEIIEECIAVVEAETSRLRLGDRTQDHLVSKLKEMI